MLSQTDIRAFVADGYLALRGAVTQHVVQACREIIWAELGNQGVARDDVSTWEVPVVRIPCPEGGPFAEAGTTQVVTEACDQLIGPGRWWRRQGVGGTIPVRFPSEQDPGDAGWHIEASYGEPGQWRVNLSSRSRGLLALYLFTDAEPDGAPTRIRPGSHLDVPAVLAPAGDDGLDATLAGQRAAQASAHRPTVLATGNAGDVFLCHPFLVHAASWPHRGRLPRMMAQPGVALHGQFAFDPADLSPVERAILAGLGPAAADEAGTPPASRDQRPRRGQPSRPRTATS
ncbi:MAG: phytanoyl-CoA dioxygenase family protein [Streptosporangiaceae bacterium]